MNNLQLANEGLMLISQNERGTTAVSTPTKITSQVATLKSNLDFHHELPYTKKVIHQG